MKIENKKYINNTGYEFEIIDYINARNVNVIFKGSNTKQKNNNPTHKK